MEWYRVTKRINGRFYLYWQKTYRVGSSVKTLNKYIGPGANPPRRRSLAAEIESPPQTHKTLRAEYGAGNMTKTEYLEAITTPAAEPEPRGLYFCGRCEQPNDELNFEKHCPRCASGTHFIKATQYSTCYMCGKDTPSLISANLCAECAQ